jgi:hypothetical protein
MARPQVADGGDGHQILRVTANIFIGIGWKARRKKPTSRTTCKWRDSIKMDFREIGWDCMDWIFLGQDMDQWKALVNAVMNIRIP